MGWKQLMFSCGNSLLEEHPVQPEEGGSIPTLPLHQLLKVEQCNRIQIQGFIERWHYLHSTFGITDSYSFRVLFKDRTVGGAIFGQPAAFNVAEKYTDGKPLVELRRFALVDNLPKNSESFSLAVMFRKLKKLGVGRILSYADPSFGHSGTIYKATGFKFMGQTAPRKHIFWKGKKYPDRNIHQTNFPFHREIRAALQSGEASVIEVGSKLIFLKDL